MNNEGLIKGATSFGGFNIANSCAVDISMISRLT